MSGNQQQQFGNQGYQHQQGYSSQGNQMMNQNMPQQQQMQQMQQGMMGGYPQTNYNPRMQGYANNYPTPNFPQQNVNNFQQNRFQQSYGSTQQYQQQNYAYPNQINNMNQIPRATNPGMSRIQSMPNPNQGMNMQNSMNMAQPINTTQQAPNPNNLMGVNRPQSPAPSIGSVAQHMNQNGGNAFSNIQPNQTTSMVKQEPSPQQTRSRTIFDDLLEGFEDVFARLIAKDEMLGVYDKDEIAVGVEYSVNKFIQKAQVVELYFNQMIARRSAGNPQDVLTEEIKDLKAEIHRKDQWIQKMHLTSKKWFDLLKTEEMKKQSNSIAALETMSANPNYRKTKN